MVGGVESGGLHAELILHPQLEVRQVSTEEDVVLLRFCPRRAAFCEQRSVLFEESDVLFEQNGVCSKTKLFCSSTSYSC